VGRKSGTYRKKQAGERERSRPDRGGGNPFEDTSILDNLNRTGRVRHSIGTKEIELMRGRQGGGEKTKKGGGGKDRRRTKKEEEKLVGGHMEWHIVQSVPGQEAVFELEGHKHNGKNSSLGKENRLGGAPDKAGGEN